MTSKAGPQKPARMAPGRSPSKRHWWRWILAGVAVLAGLVVAAVAMFVKLQPSPAPLTLPAAAGAPAGPLDGTWDAAAGSVAGFRVQESALGVSNDVVGRTNAVNGAISVHNGKVTAAMFRIDLTAIKVNGKAQPQFATSLDTRDHPGATFTLTRPVTLSTAFASGAAITTTAAGHLTMHGASRLVTVTISCRRDGSALQAAGSIPIAFSGWGIKGPAGFGFLGSLADHGVAEFLLILHRGT
jgi:polyisoprenoid-binding protein YceI